MFDLDYPYRTAEANYIARTLGGLKTSKTQYVVFGCVWVL